MTDKYQFHNTIATLTNKEQMNQTFYYDKKIKSLDKRSHSKTKLVRYFKEIKKILEERRRWIGHDINVKPWKLTCGSSQPGAGYICCARHFLESRSDFKEQKLALQELVENAGHIFELYPKYHCECNRIEMYWGRAKREARLKCDYTLSHLSLICIRFSIRLTI